MMVNNDKPVVFVVDDDPHLREALDGLIRSIQLNVQTFGTTEAFLNFKRPDAPGCLVLDIRLPGLNGLDFQRDLEKSNIDLPIIFITGHGDVPMSVRAIKAGAIEFLTKPFRHQDLVDAIYIGIERDRFRRRAMATIAELQRRFVLLTARERQIMQKVVSGGPNKKFLPNLRSASSQ
jgi:FixJ family two-component response regulator